MSFRTYARNFRHARVILSTLLCIFLCTHCLSQHKTFSLGLGAGPSLVSMRDNDIIDQFSESGLRYTISALAESSLKNGLFFDLTLSYDQKGSDIKRYMVYDSLGNSLGYATGSNKINYISLSPHFGKYFGDKIRFGIRTGPFISFFLDHRLVTRFENGSTRSESVDFMYKKTDYGISSSLNLSIPLKKTCNLDFFLSNQLGLANISSTEVVADGSLKTNSFSFIVLFKFHL